MGSPPDKFKPPPRLGNYDVREALGEGGMATVFRAEHVLLQRAAAIKFLHANLGSNEPARARFLREARVVAKLTHPNVVSIFDFGVTDDGTYYLASELVDGHTLREFLRGRRLEAWRALRFARQIAAGVGNAHEAGVIHRDLKPGNVMVVADKTAVEGHRLKVLDFGIAKSVGTPPASDIEVTEIGIVVGTPGYMSPEQCRADTDLGPTTDIYSLGVVLYVMLCGQPPFIANDVFVLSEMHINTPPPVPSASCGCSPAVDELVLRMLAKSPVDRPSSMDQVIAMIDAALAVTPVVAADPGSMEVESPRSTEKLEVSRFASGTSPSESSRMATFPLTPAPRGRSRMRLALVMFAIAGVGVIAALAWPTDPDPPQPQTSTSPSETPPVTPDAPPLATEPAASVTPTPTTSDSTPPPPPATEPPPVTATSSTRPPATKRPVRRPPPPHAKRKRPASGSGSGSEAPDYSFETPVN